MGPPNSKCRIDLCTYMRLVDDVFRRNSLFRVPGHAHYHHATCLITPVTFFDAFHDTLPRIGVIGTQVTSAFGISFSFCLCNFFQLICKSVLFLSCKFNL